MTEEKIKSAFRKSRHSKTRKGVHGKKPKIEIFIIPRDKRLDTFKGRIQLALEELTDIEKRTRYQYKNKPFTATAGVERVIEHLRKAIKIFEKEELHG